MPLFEVDTTAVEPIFHSLYSYVFDLDNGGNSAVDMDRPVPSAIFIVNFDKVLSGNISNSPLCLLFVKVN